MSNPKRAGSFRRPLSDLERAFVLDSREAIINERARLDCLEALVEVDLDQVIEEQDETDLQGEIACAGGKCDIF